MAAPKKSPKKTAKKADTTPTSPSKGAASKPKKTAAARKPADAAPAEPVEEVIRSANPADRKAAMEAFLEEQGVDKDINLAKAPKPLPPAVRESNPVDRKAAVEQLVEESGVASVLRKAPWKKRDSAAAVAPTTGNAPPLPPQPAEPNREKPRVQMTKAPIEPTAGKSPPRTVILDSNALMMQFQFHVDIERELKRILTFNYDIIVPSIVIDELTRISKAANQKAATEARMAIELAKTFKVVDSPGDGDTGILRLAEKENAVVVTNDKVLRARLRAKDIANIYMRSRAFLTVEGHIPGM